MKRRTFLQMTGAASAAAVAGLPFSAAATSKESMMIDEAKVRNRNQNRSTVVCRHGIVCASQPLASMAGIDILKAGGNVIDAAIAANATLGVVEPMSCGLGGDLFAILWIEKDQRLYGLNASGRAPYDWDLDAAGALGLKSIPGNSPLGWSVPGCASGWDSLAGRFGSMPFSKLLEPAIAYATEGFPVSPIIAGGWRFDAKKFPTLGKTFMPKGKAPRFGEIFTNPALAKTLAILAKDGAGAFYAGEIAEKIVRFSKKEGGRFSRKDFEDHACNWVDPVSTSYRGYDVWELPPNGQGIAVLQMLNILEQFDIGELGANSAEHLHLLIEAKKLAFEDRAKYYADMDFADVPLEWLISKEYGKERAKLISRNRASQKVRPGDPALDSDTIYLAAADDEGNMISFIQSNYSAWGSHYVPEGLGFTLQNRGESFSLDPNHLNRLEPHKRPFHTIIPGFMTKADRPVWSFGVMGGDFQPQGHSQVVMNIVDFGMSAQQAGDQPRIRHYGSSSPRGSQMRGGGDVGFEHHIPGEVKLKLAEMGHRIRPGSGAQGGYQSVWREEGPRRYFGGSDPRKDGAAIGY